MADHASDYKRGEMEIGEQVATVVGLDGCHRAPAPAPGVLQPHRGALALGAARIVHGVDVHRQGVTEAGLHVAGGQVDQEGRQPLSPPSLPWLSSSLWSAAVGRLIPAGTGAYLRSLQKIANERDAALTSAREEAIEELPADLALELEGSES